MSSDTKVYDDEDSGEPWLDRALDVEDVSQAPKSISAPQ